MSNTILGGGSRLNKLNKLAEHLERSWRTVYVDLAGNDVSGDGTLSKPFATVARALQEGVGTTRTLTVSLNAGDHATSTIKLEDNAVIFAGAGRLSMTASEGLLFHLSSARLIVDVDVIDVSTASYSAALYLTSGSKVQLRDNVVSLTRAQGLFINHSGQNSYYGGSNTVTSTGSIPKIVGSANSEPVALCEAGVTYTNIT